jgi:hypothetical protein
VEGNHNLDGNTAAAGVAVDSSAEVEGSNTEDMGGIVVCGQIVVADVAEMAQDLVGVEEVVLVQTLFLPYCQSD